MDKIKKIFGLGKSDPSQQPITQTQIPSSQQELLIDLPPIKREKVNQKVSVEELDLQKIITMKAELRTERLEKKSEPQTIPLMLTYKTEDIDLEKNNMSLDMVIVIDVSGSMSGYKIQLVRETLLLIIDQLTPHDRLSLVVFDDTAQILTNLSPMTDEFKEKFKLIVKEKIYDRGSTNIKQAMEFGYEVLLQRKHINDVTTMLLLSDGQDTCGNNQESIKKRLQELDQLMKQKNMDYKVNSFGYGTDHDEKVLAMISSQNNGNFYYIKETKQIGECFGECLGYLMSFLAKQAELTYFASDNCKIVKKYGVQFENDGSVQKAIIKIGNLAAGIEKNNILDLLIPANFELKEQNLGFIILNYVANDKSHMTKVETVFQVAQDGNTGQVNTKLEENMVRIKASEVLVEAQKDIQKGDVETAKYKMKAFKQQQQQNQFISKGFCAKMDNIMNEDEMAKDSKTLQEREEVLQQQRYAPTMAQMNLQCENKAQKKMMSIFKK